MVQHDNGDNFGAVIYAHEGGRAVPRQHALVRLAEGTEHGGGSLPSANGRARGGGTRGRAPTYSTVLGNAPLHSRAARPESRPRSQARQHTTIRRAQDQVCSAPLRGSAPHADGALRHASVQTWPDQLATSASLARARASYVQANDALGMANVLRTSADMVGAVSDFRRGSSLPFSYLKAREKYERAADLFDGLLQESAWSENTQRRQIMLTKARERGAIVRKAIEPSVSRTNALEQGFEAASSGMTVAFLPADVRVLRHSGTVLTQR
mmetsp:Transcript_9157/g.23257  ORF Transcript_9157/g.23257 Transcript_9157/m.23257 type:complete len:268 (-) Transcript_9157:171-974(-)